MSDFFNSTALILSISSTSILVIGLILSLKSRSYNWGFFYLFFLLAFELLSIYIGVILKSNDNILFILSFLLHFLFLTHFYTLKLYPKTNAIKPVLYAAGILLVVLSLYSQIGFFEDYGRFILSLVITAYSLAYIYHLVSGTFKAQGASNALNFTVLFFFCTDAFLAIATKYLVSNHLSLVSWFWFFRAILLQIFYIGLIYYTYKHRKTQAEPKP